MFGVPLAKHIFLFFMFMKNFLLIATATAALSTVHAYAEDIVCDGLVYTVTNGTEVTVKGFDEPTENLVIPASFTSDGTEYTVVAIADEAFRLAGLRTVSLPESLKSIGNSAFAFNMFMSQCDLPSGLEYVGENAFQRCWSAIMKPVGIKEIGTGAFWECSKITDVILPADAKIADKAFMYCTGVKTLVLEGAPESVGECAFAFNSLEELTVKSEVPPTFIPEEVITYGDYETRDYEWTLDLADVVLKVPAGAKSAYTGDKGWSVFTNVEELKSDDITEFSVAPFGYKVVSDGEVAVNSFDGSVLKCAVPATVEYAGHNFKVTEISGNAFANSSLEEISIAGSVKSIDENAFSNSSSLASVTFEEGTETIGKNAFSNTGLTEVVLPTGMKDVGMAAFINCKNLSSLSLPEGINIDILAFLNCGLSKIVLNGAPGKVGESSMTSLELRDIIFHTTVVPDISPANIWLTIADRFNDQVVLTVDNEEMAKKFMKVQQWCVFKAILPAGESYDTEAPYLPQNELSDIKDVNSSTGLKAFVPKENSIRILTPFYYSFIVWDGKQGIRIDDFTNRISLSTWWDSFKSGDYINGYIIGMMNPENGIFTSTSHSVETSACADNMKPLEVTGKQIAEDTNNAYRYAYVAINGNLNKDNFTSEDGQQFSLKNINDEDLGSSETAESVRVRGIYMRNNSQTGTDHCLIIVDPSDFYTAGIINVTTEKEASTIYSLTGVNLGTDDGALAPGIYIRNNCKFIKR